MTLAGICLTHAHIGHYTGLVYLGKEAMATRQLPVWAMPRMQAYLQDHQPWAALCEHQHLQLQELSDQAQQALNERITVTPLLVPHRAEFSETIGLIISGPSRRVLWLPDIDSWDDCQSSLEELLGQVDVAYVDGTFFDGDELVGRSLQDVPHPTVLQTLQQLASLPATERAKVRFVHLNHTNPLLDSTSAAAATVEQAGSQVARQGEQQSL